MALTSDSTNDPAPPPIPPKSDEKVSADQQNHSLPILRPRSSSNVGSGGNKDTAAGSAKPLNPSVALVGKASSRTRSFTLATSSPSPNDLNLVVPQLSGLRASISGEGEIILEIGKTFSYFRRVDTEPRTQRKILFALNLRHNNFNRNRLGANKVIQDSNTKSDKTGKRGGALGGIGDKLTSLLRSKKQKKTRAGIFHALNLAVHDIRLTESLAIADMLSESTLTKKRPFDANRVFLHAMANRMQILCLQMLEKGFPVNVNNPVFAANPPGKDKKHGSVPEEKDDAFTFPSYFQLAVSLNLTELCRAMIKAKADIDLSWYQITPLLCACLQGSESMVKLLIDGGANPNQKLGFEDFLLLKRFKASKSAMRTAEKYDTNVGLGVPSPVLSVAESPGLNEGFKQFGQKAAIQFDGAYTAGKDLYLFEMTAMSGNLGIAAYILEQTNQLFIASSCFGLLLSEDFGWTRQLLASGVKVDQKDPSGSTCIHLAARRGNVDMLIAILQGGGNINSKGANGWTPLHEAISFSHLAAFHYLLLKGADITIENDAKETPKALAVRRGFDAATIASFFEEKGDVKAYEQREKIIQDFESIKYPSSLVSQKESKGKSDKPKGFGSIFGKTTSSSSTASLTPSVKANSRSLFGRQSSYSASPPK